MDKKWIIAAFIAIFALSSCLEKKFIKGPKRMKRNLMTLTFPLFNQQRRVLEVSYANSGVKANVYFEVYDEIPVEQDEYTYTKKTNVTPRSLQHILPITAFIKVLSTCRPICEKYIYTPAFFAQTLIEADVTNGSIQASDSPCKEGGNPTTPTLGEYDSHMATSFRETPR